jgi:hypothetical protein
MHRFMRLLPLAAFLSIALLARADEPPIIAKARAYLGSEDALNAVRSVHLVGSVVDAAADKTGGAPASTVDIIFQKPAQHRLVFTQTRLVKPVGIPTDDQRAGLAPQPDTKSTVVRTDALNGYDAWERLQANANPPRLALLTVDQIRVLRADVWENLGYYRGIEATGGTMEDQGPATIDGTACEKIAFTHSTNVVYYRYFDQATGRLVYTETAGGLKIREEGTIEASGIKFPQKIVTIEPVPASGAAPRSTTLALEQVTVNEVFPDSLFAVPLPPVPVRAPVPAMAAPAAPAPAAPAPAPAGTP